MSYTFPLSRYYELIRHVLFQISENTDSQKPIDIKISGDGAQITSFPHTCSFHFEFYSHSRKLCHHKVKILKFVKCR